MVAFCAVHRNLAHGMRMVFDINKHQLAEYRLTMPKLGTQTLRLHYLSEAQLATYLQSISRQLDVLHRQGLSHNDVKPWNIRVQGDEAWLVDMDAVKAFGTRSSIFTHGYRYPQPSEEQVATKLNDIWAMLMMVVNFHHTTLFMLYIQALGRHGQIDRTIPNQPGSHSSNLLSILRGKRCATLDVILDRLGTDDAEGLTVMGDMMPLWEMMRTPDTASSSVARGAGAGAGSMRTPFLRIESEKPTSSSACCGGCVIT